MPDSRPMVSIRIQPIPTRVSLGRFNGVTAITRRWADGDHKRCTLCEVCTAMGDGTCTVLTEEDVTEGGAPLYSCRGLDDDRVISRVPDAFGRP